MQKSFVQLLTVSSCLLPYRLVHLFGLVVGGHHAAQGLAGCVVVSGRAGGPEGIELCAYFVGGDGIVLLNEDEAVVGLVEVFGLDQKLLVEFFAGAQAGFHDFDALGAHEADHVSGKVQDLHGLAHVKHKQFAVFGHGPRREHQLAGLRDGHEVPDDSLVRYGYRAALLDLFLEERNYGACTSKYVAESCGAVFHLAVRVCTCALHQHLAHALGSTHDVGGVHRLVGADHHEAFGVVLFAAFDYVFAAEHVVLYGFYAVVLHKRHMLVGCSVDYYLRFMSFEDSFECLDVRDGADFNLEVQVVLVLDSQFLLHVVGTVLVDVQDYELSGAHLGKLAADFASYASAAAGNQDYLVPVVFLGSVIHHELLASEQKLLHAEVPESDFGAQIGVGHMRRIIDTDLAACVLVVVVELPTFVIVHVGNSEDYFLDVQVLEGLDHIIALAEDPESVHLAADLLAAHVNEAHGLVDGILVGHQFLHQAHAYASRTQDGNVDLFLLFRVYVIHAGEDLQQCDQESALLGLGVSQLEGIAIGHAHTQRKHQTQAHECKHGYDRHVLVRRKARDDEIGSKTYGVEDHQAHIDLDSAVAQNLAVDLAEESAREDADQICGEVEQDTVQAQALRSVQKRKDEDIGQSHDKDVIEYQKPFDLRDCGPFVIVFH